MAGLIERNPRAYERAKANLRRLIPAPESAKYALSRAASRLHQRYVQTYAFIHINKCGGTSLERALGIPLLNHDTALQRREVLGEKEWERRFTFTLVRNPYDRYVSLYFYRMRRSTEPLETLIEGFDPWLAGMEALGQTPGAFEAEPTNGPMANWVIDGAGNKIVDHVYRLEALEACAADLTERLKRPIRIQHVKERSHDYDKREILEMKDFRPRLRALLAADFEMFGYDP